MTIQEYKKKYASLVQRCKILHENIKKLLKANEELGSEALEQNINPEIQSRGGPIKDELDALHERVEAAEIVGQSDFEEMKIILEEIWDEILLLVSINGSETILKNYGLELRALVLEICALFSVINKDIYENIQNMYSIYASKINTLGNGINYKVYPNPATKGEPILIDIVNMGNRKLEMKAGNYIHSFIPQLPANLEDYHPDTLNEINSLDLSNLISNFNPTNFIREPVISLSNHENYIVYDINGKRLTSGTTNSRLGQQSVGIDISGDITANFITGVNIISISGYKNPFIVISN